MPLEQVKCIKEQLAVVQPSAEQDKEKTNFLKYLQCKSMLQRAYHKFKSGYSCYDDFYEKSVNAHNQAGHCDAGHARIPHQPGAGEAVRTEN